MEKFFYEVPMGANTPEKMLDKFNIRELIEFERYCRDYEYYDEERALYFDGAKVWTSWFKGDVDGFVNKSREMAKVKNHPSKHKISNVVIWLNGNKAIAECICTIQLRDMLGDELVDLHSYVRLHYKAEKNGDGIWKIRSFQGIHEKDTLASAFNDGKWAAPREEVQKYRPCFWNMMYRQHIFNPADNKPQDDSVGEDIPTTVRNLYEESSRWFFE
ncbi:MAG: nuclear transport factor 2 family protein [Clostridiales Family XIII bacterium]|jgi:hypothetical protein|nr:nuclear transport factor 2 family protein [Clostridiales Family XIII bacterium]